MTMALRDLDFCAATPVLPFLCALQLDALKLGWCKIAAGDGAVAISELLLFNSSLTSLDLRGNAFGNDGAILISRGLRAAENKKLGDIDLGYNEIKDDGACSLAQVRLLGYLLTCGAVLYLVSPASPLIIYLCCFRLSRLTQRQLPHT
jgi:hypothetical protein